MSMSTARIFKKERPSIDKPRISRGSAHLTPEMRDLFDRLYYGANTVDPYANKPITEDRQKNTKKSRFVLPMHFRSDLEKAFTIFDVERCGVLRSDVLRIALRCLGFEPKNEDINALCGLVGYKEEVGLNFSDFEHIMTRTMTLKDTESELRNAFKLFSKATKGEVNFEELKEVNDLLGESLNNEELKEMINAIDKNKTGRVCEAEFLEFCRETVLWDYK